MTIQSQYLKRDQYINCGHTILLPFITRTGARVTHK